MRVLLVGEYSGVHTNLAKGLKAQGHEVYVIGDTDGYKKIGSPDLFIFKKRLYSRFRAINLLLTLYYILLDFLGIKGLFYSITKISEIKKIKNYDVVQLINTKPFSSISSFGNLLLLYFLFKQNNKIFLCGLGDDYAWVKSCLQKNPKYSKFDRYNLKKTRYFLWSFLYIYGIGFKILDRYVIKKSSKIIPGLYDYFLAYQFTDFKEKVTEILPLPIENLEKKAIPFKFNQYPIKIFHGWQVGREIDKGSDLLDEAIQILMKEYPTKVEYQIVSGVSYDEYIRRFNESVIYIDQCYSLDKGMNAILGMRAGKIVLSGFEREVAEYFNIHNSDCLVNALPDKVSIFKELEKLILNPELMEKISVEAISFVEKHHSLEIVTQEYIKIWSEN